MFLSLEIDFKSLTYTIHHMPGGRRPPGELGQQSQIDIKTTFSYPQICYEFKISPNLHKELIHTRTYTHTHTHTHTQIHTQDQSV